MPACAWATRDKKWPPGVIRLGALCGGSRPVCSGPCKKIKVWPEIGDYHRLDAGQHHRRSQPSDRPDHRSRSEEHTSELQSLMRISYAVFCLKKKKYIQK